jgi:AbrB family looped-hinge helix DNA binding protein
MAAPHVEMAANGRLVIPAKVRSELGISKGATFVVEVEDGVIKLVPFDLVIQRIQDEVRRYVPEGVSLSDELIADRRREAELE